MTEGYEAGDINLVDDEDHYDDEVVADHANGSLAELPVRVATYLATSLADEPDDVEVTSSVQGSTVKVSVTVAPSDMGRVIGRRGRTAQALRTVVGAAGAKVGATTNVDIVDV